MPRAWLGLKARAWAWLGRALAWESSGPSPSPPPGLGLAWLGPRPGLEHRIFFSNARRTTHPDTFYGFERSTKRILRGGGGPTIIFYPSTQARACGLGLAYNFSSPGPQALQSPTAGLAWLGPERAWLQGLRASGQALGITTSTI
ncbi:hypothetical protein DFH06DRAFT_1448127 [Mycena polygramma]|nr:hypothetical protein DFH06DRAFT_1448127 [Mycena polygramma]